MYRTTFSGSHSEQLSITIATALAKLKETPPTKTDFMLANVVDPEALDEFVTDGGQDVLVAFTIDDYHVITDSSGKVQIQSLEA